MKPEEYQNTCNKYYELFSSPLGQEVLQDLIDLSGFKKTIAIPTTTTGTYDPIALALNEGARKLIIQILKKYDTGAPIHRIKPISSVFVDNSLLNNQAI